MLYYNFNNYEGFKERFGVRTCGNGEKSRKNKILLSYVKQPSLLRACRESGNYSELNLENMTQLWSVLSNKIENASYDFRRNNRDFREGIYICGVVLASSHYYLDELNGVCEDGDIKKIRYVNRENHRVFKMKAGRFFNKCLEDMGLTSWPEPVRLWLCEEFQRKWEVYAASSRVSKTGDLTLHVDDNFSDIYDSDECDGDFWSCMVDDGQWYFYRDAVNAQAAYLRNKQGSIVARCIVFNEVRDDQTGEVLRLAERQYSTDGDECLKRLLVDALIREKKIDGYKKVGVGCHDNRAYVGVDGSDWSCRNFSIECNLDDGDTLSYQDSFVWYNIQENRAYNYDAEDAVECLNDTSSSFHDNRSWDDYNQRWTNEDLYEVWYDGGYHNTDYYTREDEFVEIGDTWYLRSECKQCPECGDWMHEDADNMYYSEITDEYYCCEDCRYRGEDNYKAENWYWSEYDEEYVEDDDDLLTVNVWKWSIYRNDGYYSSQTIKSDTLQKLIDREDVFLCNGKWYEQPFTLELNYSNTHWDVWDRRWTVCVNVAKVYNN